MYAAVELADTAVKIPGTNPDADTKLNTEPSYVLATKVPVVPTYNPPAVNPNEGLASDADTKAEPDTGTTTAPPTNCGLLTYDCCVSNFILFVCFII